MPIIEIKILIMDINIFIILQIFSGLLIMIILSEDCFLFIVKISVVGVAAIVGQLPPDQIQQALKEMCLIQIKPLCQLIEVMIIKTFYLILSCFLYFCQCFWTLCITSNVGHTTALIIFFYYLQHDSTGGLKFSHRLFRDLRVGVFI